MSNTEQTGGVEVAPMHPALVAAGQWWANKLCGGAPGRNNGDNSAAGGMAAVMSLMVEARKPDPQATAVDAFADIVARRLSEKVARGCKWLTLDTDYGPGYELGQCLDQAGLRHASGRMPWKTMMWINADKTGENITVRVAEGYHAETVTIYPATDSTTQAPAEKGGAS